MADPFQPFAYVAAFALVFRTNVAYNRYWECTTSVTLMAAKWGDALVEALTFDELINTNKVRPATIRTRTMGVSPQPILCIQRLEGEAGEKWLEQRRRYQALMVRRFSLMHALALQYLRRDDSLGDQITCHHVPFHAVPTHPIPSQSTPSHPNPTQPIPSQPTQFHSAASHPIPSHPLRSYPNVFRPSPPDHMAWHLVRQSSANHRTGQRGTSRAWRCVGLLTFPPSWVLPSSPSLPLLSSQPPALLASPFLPPPHSPRIPVIALLVHTCARIHYLLLTTYYLLPTLLLLVYTCARMASVVSPSQPIAAFGGMPHYLLLTTYYLKYYSLLTTHYLLLTTYY